MDFIAELELAQDMLAIKSLVDGVKLSFVATPTPEKGDFVKSPTAVALGIASVEDINNIGKSPILHREHHRELIELTGTGSIYS